MIKVLLTDTAYPDTSVEMEELGKIGAELVRPKDISTEALIEAGRDCDGILCDYAEINAEVIRGLDKCKIIAEAGMGVDNIDLEAAAAKGIMVANVPHYCVNEVADHAMALFLACAKKIIPYHRDVTAGKWDCTTHAPIYRLAGRKFCCFGLGRIASKVAKRAQAFEMDVYAYDPFLPDSAFETAGVTRVDSLEKLAALADVLSVHVPPTPETRGIINQDIFKLMKPESILINVARGALVNEADLITALREGRLFAAGLDVRQTEPPALDDPLLSMDRVVLTPHSAFFSVQAETELRQTMTREVVRVLSGGQPDSWVNKRFFKNPL